VQKFLPIFYNFFITIKKSKQYKLIKFFVIFHDFFFLQFVLFHNCRASGAFFFIDIEIIVFKSFKPIHTRSNGYKIFIAYLTNNYVCISSTFLLKTKQKAVANIFFI